MAGINPAFIPQRVVERRRREKEKGRNHCLPQVGVWARFFIPSVAGRRKEKGGGGGK